MSNEVSVPAAASEFFRRQLITNIHTPPLSSGKEATVYRCTAHPSTGRGYLALKAYRPIEERAFRNDAIYQHGRYTVTGSSRVDRALRNKSTFGLRAAGKEWMHAERLTLMRLKAAGADVPEAVSSVNGALLMEFIGDEYAAPRLHEASICAADLPDCWETLLRTMRIALQHDRVHADLSAYNVLWWDGRPVVIDWPQAVDPCVNDSAQWLLQRDLTNLANWFRRRGLDVDAGVVANDLWQAWLYGGKNSEMT
jgi:RIO kinase 1